MMGLSFEDDVACGIQMHLGLVKGPVVSDRNKHLNFITVQKCAFVYR